MKYIYVLLQVMKQIWKSFEGSFFFVTFVVVNLAQVQSLCSGDDRRAAEVSEYCSKGQSTCNAMLPSRESF